MDIIHESIGALDGEAVKEQKSMSDLTREYVETALKMGMAAPDVREWIEDSLIAIYGKQYRPLSQEEADELIDIRAARST